MSKRVDAMRMPCPMCGAGPGVRCLGKRGKRASVHRARLTSSVPAPTKASGFYLSPEWRRARYEAIKLHGGRCQCCGVAARAGTSLHVDHVKPRSRFPELALSVANLQVLCEDCNIGKGARDQTDWRGAS